MPPALVAEARVWADEPEGFLYIRSDSIRSAFGLAVAVSQRAGRTIRGDQPGDNPLAVGLLDDFSIPQDPDPEGTEKARLTHPLYSAVDTRQGFRWAYAMWLAKAPLSLLRLPPAMDGDVEAVLDTVANERWNHTRPTIVASVVSADQVAVAYGERIGWRMGFASPDGTPIGMSTPHAAVLDVDAPPR